ncbi:MAG TPA: GntR family transcriptional regulator [Plantibacter sp.]|uniref:GntR family transcriptional regulator n=1 Tax=unclassified Plantibacter TaxID=2624265 RepID=UPI002CAD5D93|nr:GntR family transcriptional regulator [Plantibacter sp.]
MPVPSSQPALGRRSLRDVAADRIRAAIFDGTLLPGEHLNDAELQEWLGMSRTPIREGLNDLQRIGLVEMAAQRYTRVALPDPARRTEVQQTIGAMLGGIVRVTVPTLTPAQTKTLLGLVDKQIAELPNRDADTFMPRAWEFATQVMDMCTVRMLVDVTKDMLDALSFQMMSTAAVAEVRWELIDEGTTRLRDALAAGDAIAAELAIEHTFRLSEPD